MSIYTNLIQIDVELTTRDDLVKQKAELETKARQQSQDQSDIYQYLRNKLKDNYVAIAELENKVRRFRARQRLQNHEQHCLRAFYKCGGDGAYEPVPECYEACSAIFQKEKAICRLALSGIA